MFQLCFWLGVMQLVLFGICTAAKNRFEEFKDERDAFKFEENIKSYGILLAHISSFASINAWGTLQQIVVHNLGLTEVYSKQLFAFGVVILSGCCMGVVLIATSKARRRLYLADDGKTDSFEEAENDLAKETEHDVVGMTISFQLVQVIRFTLDGHLPNAEGVYEHPDAHYHPYRRVLCLIGSALLFALLVIKRPSKMLTGQRHKRIRTVLKIAWSTSFAWSLYFATYWMVRLIFGSLAMDMDATMTVVMALVSTCVAFFCIFGLERLEESHLSEDLDTSVQHLIMSLAIMIGFSWERGFDVALDTIAKRFSFAFFAGAKNFTGAVVLLLAIILSGVVLPAWRWYILPMELNMQSEHDEKKKLEFEEQRRRDADPFAPLAVNEEDYGGNDVFGTVARSPSRRNAARVGSSIENEFVGSVVAGWKGTSRSADGYGGEYVRLPGTAPVSPAMGGMPEQRAPRSPRSLASAVVMPDIANMTHQVATLSSQVERLRNLRLSAWPREQGPEVAVRCSEWLAKLEMEAGKVSLQLVNSKMCIEEQAAHQELLEKEVQGMRMELHAAYSQFWGAPAG